MQRITIFTSIALLRIRMEKILNKAGFKDLTIIPMGQEGLRQIPRILKNSDLLLLDLDLYEANPLEVVRLVRKLESNSSIPILLLTQSDQLKSLHLSMMAGGTDFLMKPFNDDELLDKVYKVLEMQQERMQAEENRIFHEGSKEEQSPQLPWSRDFEIGVPEIDRDHREIILKYEALYLLMREGRGHEYYKELLVFLKDYVHRHFANEERYQKAIGYAESLPHKLIHEEFRLKVEKILAEKEGATPTNRDLITINLFVKDWLLHHILIEDRKMICQ